MKKYNLELGSIYLEQPNANPVETSEFSLLLTIIKHGNPPEGTSTPDLLELSALYAKLANDTPVQNRIVLDENEIKLVQKRLDNFKWQIVDPALIAFVNKLQNPSEVEVPKKSP